MNSNTRVGKERAKMRRDGGGEGLTWEGLEEVRVRYGNERGGGDRLYSL